MSSAFNGMHKIDNLVLPLPYCQLLKIIMILWVYSLPFVIAADVGLFLPVIMGLTSMAFFGLDQLGAELEGPFGVDPNDIPLLHRALAFVDDCDMMIAAAQREMAERTPSAPASAASAHAMPTPIRLPSPPPGARANANAKADPTLHHDDDDD